MNGKLTVNSENSRNGSEPIGDPRIVDGKVIQELLSLKKIKSESLYFRPQHINLTSKDKLYPQVLVRPD